MLLLCRIETGVAVPHPCGFAVVQSYRGVDGCGTPVVQERSACPQPPQWRGFIAAGATVPCAMPSPSEPLWCESKSENSGTSFRSSAPILKRGSYPDYDNNIMSVSHHFFRRGKVYG